MDSVTEAIKRVSKMHIYLFIRKNIYQVKITLLPELR